MKTPWRKQTDPRGEGERQQGQQEKGQDPLLRWREGYTESAPEVKTAECGNSPPTSEPTERPQDDQTSQGRPGKTLPRAQLKEYLQSRSDR